MSDIRIAPSRRAFMLVELVMIIVVVLVAVLAAALLTPNARRRAQLAGSIHNLQQLGAAAQAYAADNDNRVFSFSWTPGAPARTCGDFTFPTRTNYNDAAADQAVCIIRERGNRPDITTMFQWVPFILYNHLPLSDYLADALPSPTLVSPGDANRISWQRAARIAANDPNDRGQAFFRMVNRPAGSGNDLKRWPYSSSYELPTSFFSPDALIDGVPTIAQSTQSHRMYETGTPQTVLGNRRFDQVRFPSNKAFMYESNQYYFGERILYFAYAQARIPILHGDGSAFVRSMQRANPGFQPNNPFNVNPTRIAYTPELSWEAPTQSGAAQEYVNGVTRWTRSGLRGRDFQAPEIPWTP